MRTIKDVVAQLIKKHKTNDPFEIASRINILIITEALGETLGYFNTYKRIPMIHLNETLSDYRRIFVCAHELGHRMLHPKVNTSFLRKHTLYQIGRIEREANEFAAELLLPDDVIREFESNGMTIREAATTYGVPIEAALLKKL
jgi:Zn-dependent peptidase ImmA (M78 family)